MSPSAPCGSTRLCPRVHQSGSHDRRGQLTKKRTQVLRRALIEAARHAARSPYHRHRYARTASAVGRRRGSKVAAVTIARKLVEAIWHMLTSDRSFAAAGATPVL
jgi:transposase